MVVVGTSTTAAAAAAAKFSQHLVACNIYVSAGRPHYAPLMLTLLQDAQDHCSRLKAKGDGIAEPIVMVHAYADGPYDRSSFHLAGTPSHVAAVAGNLATSAVKYLLDYQGQNYSSTNSDNSTGTTVHPTVGLVDHIAVMPLKETNEDFTLDQVYNLLPLTQDEDMPDCTVPSGWVARSLGHAMEYAGANVLYYGSAHPQQTPLATVRRESTPFFKSLPPDHHSIPASAAGQATVGAPPRFAENYNLRLSPRVSHKQARTLTKRVRERNGGLLGVEALTLAYSDNRWEVACNLLRPDLASAQDIQAVVDTWELEQQAVTGADEKLVERGYRVGTTVGQCLEALERTTSTAKSENMHNQMVRERFEGYLQSSD
jgi:hypothetical protein